MTTELMPQYDSRKSFYGKAQVTSSGRGDFLYSYNTLVAEVNGEGKAVVHGTFSQTTTRHIKEFLKQNGFRADNSKQIMEYYGA